MKDSSVTKAELFEEISVLKQRIKQLEQTESDHKRTEEALKESEEIFSQFMEHSPIYVFFKDELIRPLKLSKNYELMLGRPLHECIGKTMNDLFPSDLSMSMIEDDLKVLREGKSIEVNEELNGRFYITTKFPVLRKSKPPLLAGFTIDVTDRKKAEQALSKSEEKFKKVFYTSPDSININRLSDGMFISINKGFSELTGYSEEDIIGKTSLDINIWHDANDRNKLVEGLKEKGKMENLEAKFRLKNGDIKYGMMSATLIDFDGVPHILSITRDITQRKRSEKDKMSLELRLFQAQKMEAIGTLTGGIAHDFNNILTSLLGYAALIQTKMDQGSPLRPYVDQILMASQKATDLIQSLSAFSRQQSVTLVPLNMNHTIKVAEKLLRRLITEDIELLISLTDDNMIVMADKSQMDQIIFNLITNARDAMPKGGVLTIETMITIIDSVFIKVHGFGEQGKYVQINISDTGTGMDEITRQKIFDPFFTTKEVGKGTGLGLATVYGIVKQHNGYITVDSALNRGTTFHIYLPHVRMKVHEAGHMVMPATGGKEKILIAEDNEGVRRFMREALQGHGYTILEAIDGEDAVERFKEQRNIDLIILDSVMPRKNGREAHEEIHSIDPRIKVLFTSGYTKDIVLDKGIEEKEFDFIAKPLSLNKFLQKVREVLNR